MDFSGFKSNHEKRLECQEYVAKNHASNSLRALTSCVGTTTHLEFVVILTLSNSLIRNKLNGIEAYIARIFYRQESDWTVHSRSGQSAREFQRNKTA